MYLIKNKKAQTRDLSCLICQVTWNAGCLSTAGPCCFLRQLCAHVCMCGCECMCLHDPAIQKSAHCCKTQQEMETWANGYKHEGEEGCRKATRQMKVRGKETLETREREERERESAFYFRQCLEVFWRESMWVSVCVCVSGMVCVYTDITACYCSVHVPDGGSCFSVSVSATHSELTHSLCLYCLLLTSSILFTHSHFISNFATTC